MTAVAPASTATQRPNLAVPELPGRVPLAWGSDVVAEMLRRLDIPYVALNPGASFRGLHDSLVNYLGNAQPGILLCNHEDVAVALAHGFAKATGRPMAAAVHSNVGLLHASMSIFNAWADRAPVLVLGGTGPMDATRRRPFIDWIHTSHAQGGIVRDFTKWEHQPHSVAAIPEAMIRAWQAAVTEPAGPVYLCFDVVDQERAIEVGRDLVIPNVAEYPAPAPPVADPECIEEAARRLVAADSPVILPGRLGSDAGVWAGLVDLAQRLGAQVVTDQKSTAVFPTSHPSHVASQPLTGPFVAGELEAPDVVLALERIDPFGSLKSMPARESPAALINISLDHYALRSWSADHQPVAPTAMSISASATSAVLPLLEAVQRRLRDTPDRREAADRRVDELRARRRRRADAFARHASAVWGSQPISMVRLVAELRGALGDASDTVLARTSLSWPELAWPIERPGAYVGYDGGGGIGSGPGMIVGVGLAHLETGRPVIGVTGDGDALMGISALWTAAHYRIPCLFVVANNQTYRNDEEHQERVAQTRGRPLANRWIGQRMADPPIDFAKLATSLGVEGIGPVTNPDDLAGAFRRAVDCVLSGRPVMVDVLVA